MLAGNRLLPFLNIEKLRLSIYLLELIGLRIDSLALHLTCYNRSFESNYAKIMAICSLDDDHITHLDALA